MSQFNPLTPYNDLPELPPPGDLESKLALKACIAARAALAELNMAGQLLPNQAILINTLPLLEAKDSSEIENIVTTSDNLFKYADVGEEEADHSTKEALRYRKALYTGFLKIKERPLCTRTAVEICTTIKGTNMDIRRVPGTSLKNGATNQIIYTPPEGEALLREKMSNWEKFLHEENSIDPLIKMAVGHYQFEAIHPFTDGNGRTGRVLNILFLIEQNLLTLPILYLSRYIIRNKNQYYQLLQGVTHDGEWESWILYMLAAVQESAGWTKNKIDAIRRLNIHTAEYIKEKLPQIYSKELVDLIFYQPYCRIGNVVNANLAQRQTASVYLKQLVDIGVMHEVKMGREKLFVHPKLVFLLTTDNNQFPLYQMNSAQK